MAQRWRHLGLQRENMEGGAQRGQLDKVRPDARPGADPPFTPLKIAVVGSAMKGGGYRSCKNYLDAIKSVHVDLGHSWNEQLALASKRFHASTARGMGPARQSAPLDFLKLREIDLNRAVDNPAYPYPARPGSAAVMSTFWLLRDLEATTAEHKDMSIDYAAKRVTLLLSMSKNDPRALGCERIWGCVCEGDGNPAACPFHAAVDIKEHIDKTFPHDPECPGFSVVSYGYGRGGHQRGHAHVHRGVGNNVRRSVIHQGWAAQVRQALVESNWSSSPFADRT